MANVGIYSCGLNTLAVQLQASFCILWFWILLNVFFLICEGDRWATLVNFNSTAFHAHYSIDHDSGPF